MSTFTIKAAESGFQMGRLKIVARQVVVAAQATKTEASTPCYQLVPCPFLYQVQMLLVANFETKARRYSLELEFDTSSTSSVC